MTLFLQNPVFRNFCALFTSRLAFASDCGKNSLKIHLERVCELSIADGTDSNVQRNADSYFVIFLR
jgi:hypothetical protein